MSRLRRWFLAPSAFVIGLFFLAPLAIILVYSLLMRGAYGGVSSQWTIENYTRLADPLYLTILLRTFGMAGAATLGCLIFGFPLALFISRAGSRKKGCQP